MKKQQEAFESELAAHQDRVEEIASLAQELKYDLLCDAAALQACIGMYLLLSMSVCVRIHYTMLCMYVYVCIYVFVCMCVCMYVCMDGCEYACMYDIIISFTNNFG